MKTAAEANVVALELFELATGGTMDCESEEHRSKVAQRIAKLVNYGIRCSPRGVQHTVRLNAVREAVKGLPVTVDMKEVVGDNGRTFNALELT